MDDDVHHHNENSEEISNKTSHEPNTIITPTSHKEIQSIISKLASKKSPGHDLITNNILKNLKSKALTYLASLLNSAMRLATFPRTWKHAIIVPLHNLENKPTLLQVTGQSAYYKHYLNYMKEYY